MSGSIKWWWLLAALCNTLGYNFIEVVFLVVFTIDGWGVTQ